MTAQTKVLTSKDVAIAAKAGKVLRTATRTFNTEGDGSVTVIEGQRRNTLAEKRGITVYFNRKNNVLHMTTTYDMSVMAEPAMLARSFRDLAKQKTIAPVVPQDITDFAAYRTGLDYSVTDAQGAKGWLFDELQKLGYQIVGKRTTGAVTMPSAKRLPHALLAAIVEQLTGTTAADLPEGEQTAPQDTQGANEAETVTA